MSRFDVDFKRSLEIEKRMALIPGKAEELVNQVLKTKSTKTAINSIVRFIPVSPRKKAIHAKYSNPLKFRMKNLGFEVVAKGGAANRPGSFGYLVFPDEGRGPFNPIKQEFFKRGGESSIEEIENQVIEALEKAHEDL